MISQEFVITNLIFNLFSLPVSMTSDMLRISVQDFGYEIDEQELRNEMQTHLPTHLQEQQAPEIGAEEFEAVYKWFLS